MTRRLAVVVTLAALLVAGVACTSPDDQVEDRIEDKLGDGADVEYDDGDFKVSDESGDSVEHNEGSGYPEGWPAKLEVQDDVEIVSSAVVALDGEKVLRINGESEASFADVVFKLKQQLAAADITIVDDELGGTTGLPWAEMNAQGEGFDVFVSLGIDSNRSVVTVRIDVTPTAT